MTPFKKTVEKIWYKCDLCGKEFDRTHEAEWCERLCLQKTCQHAESEPDYDTEDNKVTLFRKCKVCKAVVDQRDLSYNEFDTIMRAKIVVE